MQPLVSIIIPVYNADKYLASCMESAINQTYNNIEIILVDDGSQDSCPAICDGYSTEYKNVSVIHQKNIGPSGARNKGLKNAQGKYIYFLDSDDYICENTIKTLTQIAEKDDLDIVLFDATIVDKEGAKYIGGKNDRMYIRDYLYPEISSGAELLRDMLLNKDYTCSVPLLFIKKQFLSNNDLTFYPGIIHEDELFTFCALIKAKRVFHTPEKLYFRRIRPDSIMTSDFSLKNIDGYCTVINGLIDCYNTLNKSYLYKEFIDRIFTLLYSLMNIYSALSSEQKAIALPNIRSIYRKIHTNRAIKNVIELHYDLVAKYKNADSVIFYGAGKICNYVLDSLMTLECKLPDVIWDRDANNIRIIKGITVKTPDYNSLNSNTVLIICINDVNTCNEIVETCAKHGFDGVYKWREINNTILYIGN